MPEAGTRRLKVGDREIYLPADKVELEHLVAAGLEAQQLYEEAKEALDEIRKHVVVLAEGQRNGRSSVLLVAPTAGSARVSFAQETKLDEDVVEKLREELPAGLFERLFVSKTEHKLNKGWQKFMGLPQGADLDKLKPRISSAITVKPRTPTVKFLDDVVAVESADGAEE